MLERAACRRQLIHGWSAPVTSPPKGMLSWFSKAIRAGSKALGSRVSNLSRFVAHKMFGISLSLPPGSILAPSRDEFTWSSPNHKFDNPRGIPRNIFDNARMLLMFNEFITTFGDTFLSGNQPTLLLEDKEVEDAVRQIRKLWPRVYSQLCHTLDIVGRSVSIKHQVSVAELAKICELQIGDLVPKTSQQKCSEDTNLESGRQHMSTSESDMMSSGDSLPPSDGEVSGFESEGCSTSFYIDTTPAAHTRVNTALLASPTLNCATDITLSSSGATASNLVSADARQNAHSFACAPAPTPLGLSVPLEPKSEALAHVLTPQSGYYETRQNNEMESKAVARRSDLIHWQRIVVHHQPHLVLYLWL